MKWIKNTLKNVINLTTGLFFLPLFLLRSNDPAIAQSMTDTIHAPGNPIQIEWVSSAGTRLIHTWSPADLKAQVKKDGNLVLQDFFDQSTASLNWKDKAEIDLLIFSGKNPNEQVRIPRFMVVRGWLKLHYYRLSGRVSLDVTPKAQLRVPRTVVELASVQRISLSHHSVTYPGIQLKIRTNPAASRGEKLFTQHCLSCHGLPGKPSLTPPQLTKSIFENYESKHRLIPEVGLSAKDIRGLEAYRDALVSEKSDVKSSP